jgi:hypothetical protein
MIFCRIIALQQPVDIAILAGNVTIKTDRDKNMCANHPLLRIQVACRQLSVVMLAISSLNHVTPVYSFVCPTIALLPEFRKETGNATDKNTSPGRVERLTGCSGIQYSRRLADFCCRARGLYPVKGRLFA